LQDRAQNAKHAAVWGKTNRSFHMLKSIKIVGIVAAMATLSACGDTDMERTATGAVLGAAAAAVTGESITNGALIGGAAGAVSGTVAPALTGS
jgi:osmotically inducible lipoprotein OsmB